MRALFALLLISGGGTAAPQIVSLEVLPAEVTLRGARATQQFVAIATYADGSERDVTADAEWSISRPALVKLVGSARLAGIANGHLTFSAAVSGSRSQSAVRIEGSETPRRFSFARDIGSILTKRGCNGAACHGGVKGRGGLKLSANALYPQDDYEWITKGGGYQVLTTEVNGERAPRVDLKNPEKSLLLLKPTMEIPHGGSKRFDAGSEDYKTVLEWVRNGTPYG